MENKRKHLELIQGVINRLAQSSFLLKGWSVILVSSLFALAAKDRNPLFVYLAYLPTLSFWALDASFLHQERLFRALYESVRQKEEDRIDFGMSTVSVEGGVSSWPRVVVSRTLLLFHGTLVVAVVLIMATLVGTHR